MNSIIYDAVEGNNTLVRQLVQRPRGAPSLDAQTGEQDGTMLCVYNIVSGPAGHDNYDSGIIILPANLIMDDECASGDADTIIEELCAQLGRELVHISGSVTIIYVGGGKK